MKDEFLKYLKSIGMEKSLINRIDQVCSNLESLARREIDDIFVTDYVREDGIRVYENLRIFTEGYIVEADQFQSDNSFFSIQ